MKHVIIGNGPAGVVAAETIRKYRPHDEIWLVGDEAEPPYSRMAIPYLLIGNVAESGTYLRHAGDHYARLNIELKRGRAVKLDSAAKRIQLDDGSELGYDRLLIATGSSPATPPIPGIAVYSATKFACRAFSLAAAMELRAQGIFVTAVSPDAVETPLLAPQKGVDAAAILFSGPHLLTVEEIADLILGKVLRQRPLEVQIPRHRGWLAHLTNLFPAAGFALGPFFRRVGGRRQAAFFNDRAA